MQLGGPVAFCDTFDAPAGTGNRSGQLNGTIWGTSRVTGDMNFGSTYQVPWVPSTMNSCNGATSAKPDATDIIICNGRMQESSNDNATGCFECGTVTAMTMYVKQPFSFAGRTGTISFDVSNDTEGSHGVWPELWITDKPTPAPFLHFMSVGGPIPANGFGIRFSASTIAGQGAQLGANCPNDSNIRWTVDSIVAIRNYVIDDTEGYGTRSNMTMTPTGCVIASSGANGGLNHVEVQVSQNQIDVYATDAGTTSPLVHIASITNANLSLTQGLVWIEDAHYNADKSLRTPLQHDHTFTWDNVAFDGPVLARDLSFDVLDSLAACHDGTLCLGWDSCPSCQNPMPVVNTLPMTAANISAASARFLMFNAWWETLPTQYTITINGHTYTGAWPFPSFGKFNSGAVIIPINASDLVAGPNAIQIGTDTYIVVSNINIVLAGAGGVPSPP
jgi:hypothetical protein